MYTMRDYDELKTLEEFLQGADISTLFEGTSIDEATQQAVYNWFKFRKVCDNEKFQLFFNRLITAHSEQYYSLVRVQSIKFDPLVTQYMERLIDRSATNSENEKRTSNRSGNANNTDRTTGGDTTATEGSASTTNTDNVNTTQKGTQKGSQNGSSNDKSMSAQLPQSSTGAGAGLPDALNWNYATQQDESKNTNEQNTDNETTGNSTSKGTSKGTATNEQTTKVTHNTTVTGSNNHNENETSNGERNGSNSEVVKERSTGRSGETPELLSKAIAYISKTNAFFWLVDKLEAVFMTVYE